MKKCLHLIMLAFAIMLSANADAAKNVTLTSGKNIISCTPGTEIVATYITTKTDIIQIGCTAAWSVTYEGQEQPFKNTFGALTGAYQYKFNTEEGKTITMTINTLNLEEVVYVTEGKLQLKEESITPASGPFNWSRQGAVSVLFNMLVTASKVVVRCPTLSNKEFDCDDVRLGGSNILSCNVTNALNQAYEAGLQAGNPFLLEFSGVMDEDNEKYMDTGVLTITYIAPQKQSQLVSATTNGGKTTIDNTYTFKSFFDPEEKDGLFEFEFSGNIGEIGDKGTGGITLSMGNLDQTSEGRYYNKEVPYTIEGNTIKVDARGELRSLARMFPSIDFTAETEGDRFSIDTEHITLVIKSVRDTDGNFVFSPGQGTIGSFSYTFHYKEIEDNIAIDGDRTEDLEGSVKEEGSRIQLWIDQEIKKVDGAQVYVKVDNNQGVDDDENPIYGTGMIEIPASNIETISSDPDEGTVLGFNLPSSLEVTVIDGSKSEGETMVCTPVVGSVIRIVLQVITTNGMPHDLVINYLYKEDPSTGINKVAISRQQNAVYNIAGQRVNANAKGIVIINSKKVINN